MNTTCPVCNQPIDPTSSPFSTYKGVTYYLRSSNCMSRFDDDPKRFIAAPKSMVADPQPEAARSLLVNLFGPASQRPFAVQWWNGALDGPATQDVARATVVIKRPGVLRDMLLPPREVAFAEAYLRGDLDIDGDIGVLADQVDLLAKRVRSPRNFLRLLPDIFTLPRDRQGSPSAVLRTARPRHLKHTPRRDAQAVRFHYDVGNEFYRLWLDQNMVYSCGYFLTGTEDIDQAQEAKLDYICRKLRLHPGERLLDIGCGWGGLVRFAAREYGVDALGITLSKAQADYALRRIIDEGLEGSCRVDVLDYRNLSTDVQFDKVSSVGMVEHVGVRQLPIYFSRVFKLLRPGGLFFNQGIVVTGKPGPMGIAKKLMASVWGDGTFFDRYVFPDGELTLPNELVRQGEIVGFETRDVESLREHYALTLRHWVSRLEAHHKEAVDLVGEATYRVWRLYMSAMVYTFETGGTGLIQMLLSKPGERGHSELPLTRADLHRDRVPNGVENRRGAS